MKFHFFLPIVKLTYFIQFIDPTNPPEVVSFFVTLKEEWLNIPYYLGYTEEEIAALNSGNGAYLESQVRRFLNIWEMPDCGTSTVPLLHKLAQLAGVSSSRIRGHSGTITALCKGCASLGSYTLKYSLRCNRKNATATNGQDSGSI